MITPRMKRLLRVLGMVSLPVILFSVWSWASNSVQVSERLPVLRAAAFPVAFIAAHVATIVMGLVRPTGWTQAVSVVLLCIDALLVGLLVIVLLSLGKTGWENEVWRVLAFLVLLPTALLSGGLLLVYVRAIGKRASGCKPVGLVDDLR